MEPWIEAVRQIGAWMVSSLSVEGIISLPALLVGFLVAIAIYNFEDTKEGLKIDAATVISRVVSVDKALKAIFLVSLMPIFWPSNDSDQTVTILPLLGIAYLVGLLLLVRSLQRAFNWAKSIETGKEGNFRATMRMQYLESLPDNEKRDAWEKIWQAGNGARKLIDERQLIKLFVTSVKRIEDKGTFAPWLVQDLMSTIDTLQLDDPIIMEELVNFCMGDAFGFKNSDEVGAKKETGELHYSMNLRRLYFRTLEKTLENEGDDNSLFSLIDYTRSYLKVKGLAEAPFIKVFAPNFFNYMDKYADKNWIWETLPNDWKITLDSLVAKDTKDMSFAWLNALSRWLHNHNLFSSDGKFDMALDTVSREMLPNADPITWAKLFSFHWSSYGVEDGESSEHAQVRNFVENHPTFGVMSHVFTQFFGKNDDSITQDEMRSQVSEVLDIAARTTLFPFFHNKLAMTRYLRAIKELKEVYASDEDKLNKLEWLENTLKTIRSRVNKQKRLKNGKKKRQ